MTLCVSFHSCIYIPTAPLSVYSNQVITIGQSEQSTTHRLYVTNDNTVEDPEEVIVRLAVPEFNVPPRVTLGGTSAFNLTIMDDDGMCDDSVLT